MHDPKKVLLQGVCLCRESLVKSEDVVADLLGKLKSWLSVLVVRADLLRELPLLQLSHFPLTFPLLSKPSVLVLSDIFRVLISLVTISISIFP